MRVMRAFVPITEEELEQRRRLGLDRRDEMWDGVLHMSPAPAVEHQRILDELIMFLGPLLKRRGRGVLRSGVNVFDDRSPAANYPIPDLAYLSSGRDVLLAPDGIRGGGPDAVIEIHSPGDETYEKFPFFAKLGVREVLVIDRDTKVPEVHQLEYARYSLRSPGADGWILCTPMQIELRAIPGAPALLEVRDAEDL